jgi:sortase A
VVAALRLPTITATTYYVVAGVSTEDLKRGVGHYPSTPLPGSLGNAALAGHRTTYGAPFENLDQLHPGDPILIDLPTGQHYRYLVDSSEIVAPTDTLVLDQPKDPTVALLTLTTCHPKRSTRQRLIIHSHLDTGSSSAPLGTTLAHPATSAPATTQAAVAGTDDTVGATTTTTRATVVASVVSLANDGASTSDARTLASGWFHDPWAWPEMAAWGGLLGALVLGATMLGWWSGRPWLIRFLAAAPALVMLYFLFQNVNRLLPPGL